MSTRAVFREEWGLGGGTLLEQRGLQGRVWSMGLQREGEELKSKGNFTG